MHSKCICKEVNDRAARGEFELNDAMLEQYIASKVSRIKQLQEARKEVQKVVDKEI